MANHRRAIIREVQRLQDEAAELRAAEQSRLERVRELLEALAIGEQSDEDSASSAADTAAETTGPTEEEEAADLREGDRVKVLTGNDKGRFGVLDEDLGLTKSGNPKWRVRFSNGSTTWRIADNLEKQDS